MRFSASLVVAEIVMQNIEENALSTSWSPTTRRIDTFHHDLNGQNTGTQLTRETEENG